MKKKMLCFMLSVMVMVASLAAPVFAANNFDEYNLKFSTVLSDTSSWYKLMQSISDRMLKETEGKVKISLFPNEQLSGGNQPKGLEMIMSGSTEMDLRSGMLWTTVDDRMGAISLPFFYRDFEHIDASFLGEGGKALKDAMAEHGVKVFGFAEGGWRQLDTSTKAVRTLEDLQGMKIRLAPVPMNMDTFRALGANPLVMNFSEMFTGLQQGTVDGVETPISAGYEAGVQEICKNNTLWNYSYDCGVVSMNLELWNSFPPELQAIFTSVVEEEIANQLKTERVNNLQLVETLKGLGVTFHTLTEEERAKFTAASSVVVNAFEEKVGKEFLDKFR